MSKGGKFLLHAALFSLLNSCGEGADNKQTIEDHSLQTSEQVQDKLEAAFLLDAYSYNLMLVHYSELAVEKASTPTVISFAERSLDYHRNLQREIINLTAPKQLSLPDKPAEDVDAYLKKLEGMPAQQFEQRYLQVVYDIQTKMIGRYEEAADGPVEGYLRNWALEILPNLRAHAQTVEDLRAQL